MTVDPYLASFLEALAHCRNAAWLGLFYSITLVDVHLNWFNWFNSLSVEGGLPIILIGFCHHSKMLHECLDQ